MPALNTKAVTLLATVEGVDLNDGTAQILLRTPFTNNTIITHIIVRNASTDLDTASYSFGFNDPDYNDIIANATHTELVDDTVYTVLTAKTGATLGVAGDIFKIIANTLQGATATVDIDVFGYYF